MEVLLLGGFAHQSPQKVLVIFLRQHSGLHDCNPVYGRSREQIDADAQALAEEMRLFELVIACHEDDFHRSRWFVWKQIETGAMYYSDGFACSCHDFDGQHDLHFMTPELLGYEKGNDLKHLLREWKAGRKTKYDTEKLIACLDWHFPGFTKAVFAQFEEERKAELARDKARFEKEVENLSHTLKPKTLRRLKILADGKPHSESELDIRGGNGWVDVTQKGLATAKTVPVPGDPGYIQTVFEITKKGREVLKRIEKRLAGC